MEINYADRLVWLKVIRDVPLPSSVKLVGMTIATYGDKDGDNIFPSQRRLVAATQLGETTVRKALKMLRDNGLLWRAERGSQLGRAGISDRYRLTLPADYETRFKFIPEKGLIDDPNAYRVVHQRDVSERWAEHY